MALKMSTGCWGVTESWGWGQQRPLFLVAPGVARPCCQARFGQVCATPWGQDCPQPAVAPRRQVTKSQSSKPAPPRAGHSREPLSPEIQRVTTLCHQSRTQTLLGLRQSSLGEEGERKQSRRIEENSLQLSRGCWKRRRRCQNLFRERFKEPQRGCRALGQHRELLLQRELLAPLQGGHRSCPREICSQMGSCPAAAPSVPAWAAAPGPGCRFRPSPGGSPGSVPPSLRSRHEVSAVFLQKLMGKSGFSSKKLTQDHGFPPRFSSKNHWENQEFPPKISGFFSKVFLQKSLGKSGVSSKNPTQDH